MTLLAHLTLVLFIIAWFAGVSGWIYGTRYFLPMWSVGFRKSEIPEGYRRKMLKGYAVFVGAVLFGFIVGGLGQLAGGWE